VTKEEKVGYIGGILAGVGDEEEESSSEEESLVPAPKSAVMQLEELSDRFVLALEHVRDVVF
jgi:hypothetical protein